MSKNLKLQTKQQFEILKERFCHSDPPLRTKIVTNVSLISVQKWLKYSKSESEKIRVTNSVRAAVLRISEPLRLKAMRASVIPGHVATRQSSPTQPEEQVWQYVNV